MTQLDIIENLKTLPSSQRLEVMNALLEMILEEMEVEINWDEEERQMAEAAKLLLNDYLNDPEETVPLAKH